MQNRDGKLQKVQNIYDVWKRREAFLASLFIIVWSIPLIQYLPIFPDLLLPKVIAFSQSKIMAVVLGLLVLASFIIEFIIQLQTRLHYKKISLFESISFIRAYQFKPLLVIPIYILFLELVFVTIYLYDTFT